MYRNYKHKLEIFPFYLKKPLNYVQNTGLFKTIVGFVIHNILETGVYVFFYLIEQHSKVLLHTLQLLYMCTLCDSTNINTIIEFVPNCM